MEYERIKKQADFQKLFSKGKRAFSSSLTVVYAPSKTASMGISVGKRHGKAHIRVRIKRLLREAYRKNLSAMQGTYAVILIPKVEEDYSFQKYDKCLKYMIAKDKL